MNQQIVCVIARQRSGTTALRANLAHTRRLHNFGEIFHTGHLEGPASFFGYCREKRILLSDACAPRYLPELCTAYIDHLRSLAKAKHVLIDVKLSDWGVIRPAWGYLHEEPFFLGFLKKLDTLFIFIQRKDIVEQIVSSHIARPYDQWQNIAADTTAVVADIDIGKAVREARLILQAEKFLWTHLKSYQRCLHFVYEDLYDEGNLAADAKLAIARELGEELKFADNSPIRKNEVDKAARVGNYEEARRAIETVAARFMRPAR